MLKLIEIHVYLHHYYYYFVYHYNVNNSLFLTAFLRIFQSVPPRQFLLHAIYNYPVSC